MRIRVGQTVRTPFEPSGLVEVIEIEGQHPVTPRRTVRVRYLHDHPHGYQAGTIGRYFLDELRPARTPRLLTHIVGWLLHHANANADANDRERFYRLKHQLLERYGRQVGTDLQHIVKRCWDGPCNRCGHTGVWHEFFVQLQRWQLGAYTFHRPLQTLPTAPGPVTIEGWIRHPGHSARASRECTLWLALFFDQELFRRLLERPWSLGRTMYPLLFVKQAGWWLTRGWHRYGMRRCQDCNHRFLALGRPGYAYRCLRCDTLSEMKWASRSDELPF